MGMEGTLVHRKEKTKKQVATRELLEFNWSDSLSICLFFVFGAAVGPLAVDLHKLSECHIHEGGDPAVDGVDDEGNEAEADEGRSPLLGAQGDVDVVGELLGGPNDSVDGEGKADRLVDELPGPFDTGDEDTQTLGMDFRHELCCQ